MVGFWTVSSLAVASFAVAVSFLFAAGKEFVKTQTSTRPLQFIAWLLARPRGGLLFVEATWSFLFLVSVLVIRFVFGPLRREEAKNFQHRLVLFLFFKVFFVVDVLDLQAGDFCLWITWFSVIITLRIHAYLAHDRFEYLAAFPTTRLPQFLEILIFLGVVFALGAAWWAIWLSAFAVAGPSVFFLLAFETVSLFISTLRSMIRLIIHVRDLSSARRFERHDSLAYHIDFYGTVLLLFVTLAHYVHVLYLTGFAFSISHIFLLLYMRYVWTELREFVRQDRQFRRIRRDLEKRYPPPTEEELRALEDDCSICREPLSQASPAVTCKLGCGHVYHRLCLHSWLTTESSCPMCRAPILPVPPRHAGGNRRLGLLASIARMLPISISVAGTNEFVPSEEVVNELRAMFPDADDAALRADLRRTGNAHATIDNALAGLIPIRAPEPRVEGDAVEEENGPEDALEVDDTGDSGTGSESQSERVDVHFEDFGATDKQRRSQFLKRKEALLASARRMQAVETATPSRAPENSEPEPSGVFRDGTLSAGDRRRQILEAAERRLLSEGES